jgi:uncharacterized protein
MKLTDPFTGMFPPRKMTDAELATAMRLDVMAELDAVALYQAHIEATDNEDAKRILAHIRDEEKEHVAEFLEMLKILDPTQATELAEAKADFAEAVGHPPQVMPAPAPSGLNEAPGGGAEPSAPPMTVGSLFNAAG